MFNKDLITDSRLASARKKELTPLKLDRMNMCGIFASSDGGMYETTLDECSCADFAIQGYAQPCKHMLRLAMELNKIPSDGMQTDETAAKGKYCRGCVKQFVEESDFSEFVRFARAFNALCEGRKAETDIVCSVMDISTIDECPFFTFLKSGKPKIDKKWSKECESINNSIVKRLGTALLLNLENDKLLAMITN